MTINIENLLVIQDLLATEIDLLEEQADSLNSNSEKDTITHGIIMAEVEKYSKALCEVNAILDESQIKY